MKLYIDPGTGSMLFTILIGLIGALGFAAKAFWSKLKFRLTGGKRSETEKDTIPFVIFSDDKRYWPVFEPVCRELSSRGFDTVYMTASPDDPALDSALEHFKAEFIGEGNRAFAKLNYLDATLLLATTPGLDVYQWKRSKKVKYYVHMLHCANDSTLYRMFALDFFDAVLLSGKYQAEDIRDLEKLRDESEKELVLIGIPYMDEMVKRLESEGDSESDAKNESETTVLIAPSWGPSAIFRKFGGSIIKVLLDSGYHIIVRPHPQSFKSETEMIDSLMKEFPDSDRLEWNRDNDNFNVLCRSDILISDFSGIVFDFSLVHDKPVIYADTTFDRSPYDSWWLEDKPIWTFETLPKLGEQITEESLSSLPEMIERCLSDKKYAEGRKRAREETWAYPGEGAVRAADYIISKYRELTERKEDN